jgi:GntR family transcriptional regulator
MIGPRTGSVNKLLYKIYDIRLSCMRLTQAALRIGGIMPAARPNSSAAPVPAFQPLYVQVKGLLVASLETGEWRPGEAIPSESELAIRFGVSQGTARKAIDALAADNLVIRRQGKGTFVATHTEEKASMFRFLRIRRNDGRDEYPGSRIIDVRRGKASADIGHQLEIKVGSSVIVLRRVLEFSGEPVVLDEIVLPAALFRGLTRAKVDAYRGSLYSFFETQFGVRIVRAEEKLGAIAADPQSAVVLCVKAGEPLLAVERVTYTYGNRPVEWRRSLCTTRRHFYLNEL